MRKKTRRESSEALRKSRDDFTKAHPDWTELANADRKTLEEWQQELVAATGPERQFRQLFELSGEWIQRFLREDCEEAILLDSQVAAGTCIGIASIATEDDEFGLCILDEASKATFTEALVPLSFSRSGLWWEIGCNCHRSLMPLSEIDRFWRSEKFDRSVIGQTLLDRLIDLGLPDTNRAMLTRQHRMVPEIGRLISEVFYNGKLESVRNDANEILGMVLPKAVCWYSTLRRSNRYEYRFRTSWANHLEARWILQILERAEFLCCCLSEKYTASRRHESCGSYRLFGAARAYQQSAKRPYSSPFGR